MKKEISNFEIRKKGYEEDLEDLRKKIEEEVRKEEAERVEGRGTMNRYIAQWKIQKFGYNPEEKKRAVSAEKFARDLEEKKLQEKIDRLFEQQRAELELKIFGEWGMEGAREQDERENRIAAFKARRQKVREEEKSRKEYVQRKKEERNRAGKVINEQAGKIVTEQDNEQKSGSEEQKTKKPADLDTMFNAKAEKIQTLSMEFGDRNPAVLEVFKKKERERMRKQKEKEQEYTQEFGIDD